MDESLESDPLVDSIQLSTASLSSYQSNNSIGQLSISCRPRSRTSLSRGAGKAGVLNDKLSDGRRVIYETDFPFTPDESEPDNNQVTELIEQLDLLPATTDQQQCDINNLSCWRRSNNSWQTTGDELQSNKFNQQFVQGHQQHKDLPVQCSVGDKTLTLNDMEVKESYTNSDTAVSPIIDNVLLIEDSYYCSPLNSSLQDDQLSEDLLHDDPLLDDPLHDDPLQDDPLSDDSLSQAIVETSSCHHDKDNISLDAQLSSALHSPQKELSIDRWDIQSNDNIFSKQVKNNLQDIQGTLPSHTLLFEKCDQYTVLDSPSHPESVSYEGQDDITNIVSYSSSPSGGKNDKYGDSNIQLNDLELDLYLQDLIQDGLNTNMYPMDTNTTPHILESDNMYTSVQDMPDKDINEQIGHSRSNANDSQTNDNDFCSDQEETAMFEKFNTFSTYEFSPEYFQRKAIDSSDQSPSIDLSPSVTLDIKAKSQSNVSSNEDMFTSRQSPTLTTSSVLVPNNNSESESNILQVVEQCTVELSVPTMNSISNYHNSISEVPILFTEFLDPVQDIPEAVISEVDLHQFPLHVGSCSKLTKGSLSHANYVSSETDFYNETALLHSFMADQIVQDDAIVIAADGISLAEEKYASTNSSGSEIQNASKFEPTNRAYGLVVKETPDDTGCGPTFCNDFLFKSTIRAKRAALGFAKTFCRSIEVDQYTSPSQLTNEIDFECYNESTNLNQDFVNTDNSVQVEKKVSNECQIFNKDDKAEHQMSDHVADQFEASLTTFSTTDRPNLSNHVSSSIDISKSACSLIDIPADNSDNVTEEPSSRTFDNEDFLKRLSVLEFDESASCQDVALGNDTNMSVSIYSAPNQSVSDVDCASMNYTSSLDKVDLYTDSTLNKQPEQHRKAEDQELFHPLHLDPIQSNYIHNEDDISQSVDEKLSVSTTETTACTQANEKPLVLCANTIVSTGITNVKNVAKKRPPVARKPSLARQSSVASHVSTVSVNSGKLLCKTSESSESAKEVVRINSATLPLPKPRTSLKPKCNITTAAVGGEESQQHFSVNTAKLSSRGHSPDLNIQHQSTNLENPHKLTQSEIFLRKEVSKSGAKMTHDMLLTTLGGDLSVINSSEGKTVGCTRQASKGTVRGISAMFEALDQTEPEVVAEGGGGQRRRESWRSGNFPVAKGRRIEDGSSGHSRDSFRVLQVSLSN